MSYSSLIIRKNIVMRWWNKLSASQKRTYEYKTFGDGERWEDNRLTEDDILNIHDKFALKTK
jgi:hypothetical protein